MEPQTTPQPELAAGGGSGRAFDELALGTLYAWSVFVAPLEKQFGWKRAETSMVFTIAVVVFALTFVIAGAFR